MLDTDNITGVLLAGGRSRRMFPDAEAGGDKCLRDLGGRPMLARVIDRLAPQVGRLVINANGPPERFAAFGLPVVPDPIAGFVGPLAGVLAGMRWSLREAPAATHIATVSTDAPFIPMNLVARLAEAIAARPGHIAIASSAGAPQPVIGLWPVRLAADLEQALGAGARKVLAWIEDHGFETVAFPFATIAGRQIDPFFNANRPDEFEHARRLLQD